MTATIDRPALMDDLGVFAKSLRPNKAKTWRTRSGWRASVDTPANDFNREIAAPGANAAFPDGVVRVMCDYDFYEVALLPYRFEPLTCAEIVSALWPEMERVVTYPDSGDHWWVAMADEELEIPGQPYEIWYHVDYADSHHEDRRFESYATREEAEGRARKVVSSVTPGTTMLYSVREWREGVRLEGERFESELTIGSAA